MRPEKIKISYGITNDLGSFNNEKIHMEIEATVTAPGDADRLFDMVKQKVLSKRQVAQPSYQTRY